MMLMSQDNVITFQDVHKTYHADIGRRTVALAGLDLTVRRGEVFGIIGPNGAGKSTALKILMGFVKPSAGKIALLGEDAITPATYGRIGYLPENPCLYEHLTLLDHLRFAARVSRCSRQDTQRRIDTLLPMVGLAHAAHLPIRRYSKGMTQRAALAYALFHEPELLVLDEPMSGLDPLGRQLVVDIIRAYSGKERTILFCSHILTDVERICNRIGVMHQGRLAAVQTPQQLVEAISEADTSAGRSPLEAFFLQTVGAP